MKRHLIKSNNKIATIAVNALFIFYAIILLILGPIIAPDSSGYVDMGVIRGPLYPLWINLFKFTFGSIYLYQIVAVVQIIINLGVVYGFINYLRKTFKISDISTSFIILISFYIIFSLSRSITTESLAIPLYLIFTKYFLEYVSNQKQASLIRMLFTLFLLMLVRSQFLFVLPVLVVFFSLKAIKNKTIKTLISQIILIVLVFVLFSVSDRLYHKIVHDDFISTPYTGLQVATDAFYIAKLNDFNLFEDDTEKHLARIILEKADNQNFLHNSQEVGNSISGKVNITHYNIAYNELSHRIIKQTFFEHYGHLNEVELWKAIDKSTINMAIKIALNNPVMYIRLQFSDIIENGTYGYVNLIFYLFLLTALIFAFWKYENKLILIGMYALMAHFVNMILVAIAEPVLHRYIIYNEYLIIVFLIVSLDHFLDFQKQKEEYNRF